MATIYFEQLLIVFTSPHDAESHVLRIEGLSVQPEGGSRRTRYPVQHDIVYKCCVGKSVF